MSPRAPVVALEDAIGTQLLLAELGSGRRPLVANRYEIVELRGRGANGLVCRALDTRLNRQVALKLYPPISDAQLEHETLREAQALARLEHPNVVRIYDHDQGVVMAGEIRLRCLFVSMEFIEGRHLKAWLAEQRRSVHEILRALTAAGEGLFAAHCAGLVHRDFKPENVMIDVDGKVRVVDFGLARGQGYEFAQVGASGPVHGPGDLVSARMTLPGVAPGTPEYMAPEALSGHASASSDQYSFAAAAWEALTGELPNRFLRQPASESAAAVDPASKLPKRLRAALERGLADDPNRRYPTLAKLLDELRWVARRGRRWAIASAGAFVLGSLFVGGWAFRADTLEQAAAVSASSSAEVSDEAARRCAELGGTWLFDTVVIWASDGVGWHGVSGKYELELVPLGGCSLDARIEKVGHNSQRYSDDLVRQGARGVRVVPTAAGLELSADFSIASDKRGKLEYEFNLVFVGDQITGDFRYKGADNVSWTGLVGGGRTRPDSKLKPDLGLGACASQCRIRCPSAASREACVATRCRSTTTTIDDCGPPEPGLEPPPLTRELLGRSGRELRAELADKRSRGRCRKAARLLTGRWRVTTPTISQTWTVAADDCELTIGVSEGGSALATMPGLTTADGAWVVLGPRDEVRWALIGWDPAFGVSDDREPAVAHRNPQN